MREVAKARNEMRWNPIHPPIASNLYRYILCETKTVFGTIQIWHSYGKHEVVTPFDWDIVGEAS